MSEIRYQKWKDRITSKNTSATCILRKLPPTEKIKNIKRVHLQIATWLSALLSSPPTLNVEDFGFEKVHISQSLIFLMLPMCVEYLPDTLRERISCKCKALPSCKNNRCICIKAGFRCSTLCGCYEECCENRDVEEFNEVSNSDDEIE